MTGISRSASHPSTHIESAMETRFEVNNKVCGKTKPKEDVCRTTSDDSNLQLHSEKHPKSKISRLLRRSISLIQTSTLPKRNSRYQEMAAAESSTSSSPQDDEVGGSLPPSNDESGNEEEEITNAFVFNATSANPVSFDANNVAEFIHPVEKTTVKAVKVSRIHSQKSPHISYAARKLSLGEFKDLQWSPKAKLKKNFSETIPSPLLASARRDLHRRDSCPSLNLPSTAKRGKKRFSQRLYQVLQIILPLYIFYFGIKIINQPSASKWLSVVLVSQS